MKMEIFSPSSRKIMGKMPKRGEKSARKIYFSFISALDVCVWKIAFPFSRVLIQAKSRSTNVCEKKVHQDSSACSSAIHTEARNFLLSVETCEEEKKSRRRNTKCLAYLAQCNLYCFSLFLSFVSFLSSSSVFHFPALTTGGKKEVSLPRPRAETMTLNYNSAARTNDSAVAP
jgi:hypothetical protein